MRGLCFLFLLLPSLLWGGLNLNVALTDSNYAELIGLTSYSEQTGTIFAVVSRSAVSAPVAQYIWSVTDTASSTDFLGLQFGVSGSARDSVAVISRINSGTQSFVVFKFPTVANVVYAFALTTTGSKWQLYAGLYGNRMQLIDTSSAAALNTGDWIADHTLLDKMNWGCFQREKSSALNNAQIKLYDGWYFNRRLSVEELNNLSTSYGQSYNAQGKYSHWNFDGVINVASARGTTIPDLGTNKRALTIEAGHNNTATTFPRFIGSFMLLPGGE